MYYIYILYSRLLDRYYIGYTADLQGRLYKHKARHKGFTGSTNDWELVYSETFASKEGSRITGRVRPSRLGRFYIDRRIFAYWRIVFKQAIINQSPV